MSQSPENPGGYKPPAAGAPEPVDQVGVGQAPAGPAAEGSSPTAQHPQPAAQHPRPAGSGWVPPPSYYAPPGGFGVNLPPGVSTEIYRSGDPGQGGGTDSLALVSVILGGLAFVLGWCCGVFSIVFGVVAVLCGVLALNKGTELKPSDRTMAISGIILGVLSMLIWVGLLLFGIGMSVLSAP